MSTDAILQEFAAKKLHEPLHNISIQQGDQVTAAANGRLTVTEDGSPRLEIFLAVEPPNQGSGLRPGMIVPANAYATLTADTQRGLKLTAARVFPEHTRWNMPGFNRMVFLPSQVILVSSTIPSEKAGLEGFLSAFPEDVFNADYLVDDNCPMFGSTVHRTWLNLDFDQVQLGLRKDEDKTCWLKLWSKTAGDPGLVKLGDGFLRTLSFVLGRRLRWQASSYSIGNEECVTLRRNIKATEKHFPPLPEMLSRPLMDKQGELLRQGTLFFQEPANDPALTALQVCWDSAANIFVTRGLLQCAALEGLADYLVDEAPRSAVLSPKKNAFANLKERAAQVLLGVNALVSDDPLSQNALKCIVDGISSLGYLTSADKIRKAAELLGVRISGEEVAAWKKLRHRPAHGDFDFDFGDQTKFQAACDQTASVANILNKFVLALIGYNGPFRDYGVPGFPTRNLPN